MLSDAFLHTVPSPPTVNMSSRVGIVTRARQSGGGAPGSVVVAVVVCGACFVGVIRHIKSHPFPKLYVPPERSERCGPERCSGTFRTAAPAAAAYLLSK